MRHLMKPRGRGSLVRSTDIRQHIGPELAVQICAQLANVFKRRSRGTAGTLKLAENGDAGAQIQLAYMHYFGKGAPQNYAQARKWCLKTAAFEVVEAQTLLGRIYANG
jgi:TPR repeat protein